MLKINGRKEIRISHAEAQRKTKNSKGFFMGAIQIAGKTPNANRVPLVSLHRSTSYSSSQ
jgi:hypothetical protein